MPIMDTIRYRHSKTENRPPEVFADFGHDDQQNDAEESAEGCRFARMATSSLRELKVWQESVALAGDLTRSLRQSTRRETKALTDLLMLTAVGLAEQIADGHSRYTSEEQRDIYRSAKRDLLRVETQIAVARHADRAPDARPGDAEAPGGNRRGRRDELATLPPSR